MNGPKCKNVWKEIMQVHLLFGSFAILISEWRNCQKQIWTNEESLKKVGEGLKFIHGDIFNVKKGLFNLGESSDVELSSWLLLILQLVRGCRRQARNYRSFLRVPLKRCCCWSGSHWFAHQRCWWIQEPLPPQKLLFSNILRFFVRYIDFQLGSNEQLTHYY